MQRTRLYNLFHLNLAFSSIPESERSRVLERCYWPLLYQARENACPIAIEASGWTLEQIDKLDQNMIAEIQQLIKDGLCEFIGSGYIQAIGPLMPAAVNASNQRIGIEVYKSLLGVVPRIALVNEQAFSSGLIQIYLEAGYEAIILDWASIYSTHKDWERSWGRCIQTAGDDRGNTIPIIWCDAIVFQRFQRYAHGENDLDELNSYISSRLEGSKDGFLAIYSSDAEIFDYRPGRYQTEPDIHPTGEWQRIGAMWRHLATRDDIFLTTPADILDNAINSANRQILKLPTASAPICVKKQPKYNIVRWAVTGRDDLALNTACWRIFEKLTIQSPSEAWREILELWSSDFRTHIDDARWKKIRQRVSEIACVPTLFFPSKAGNPLKIFDIKDTERSIICVSPNITVTLNKRRGCAVQAFGPRPGEDWWAGTIQHGFFDDIAWGADFYTNLLTCEIPGKPKVTDLQNCNPEIQPGDGFVDISMQIGSELGKIEKTIRINEYLPRIEVSYLLHWQEPLLGSLRMAHVTLNPKLFSHSRLSYRCHNGGTEPEIFEIFDKNINHGRPVSPLITCSTGLGLTEGWMDIGDETRRVKLEAPRTSAAMLGLITTQTIGGNRLVRASLSAREHDDTSHEARTEALPIRPLTYSYAIELSDSTS